MMGKVEDWERRVPEFGPYDDEDSFDSAPDGGMYVIAYGFLAFGIFATAFIIGAYCFKW